MWTAISENAIRKLRSWEMYNENTEKAARHAAENIRKWKLSCLAPIVSHEEKDRKTDSTKIDCLHTNIQRWAQDQSATEKTREPMKSPARRQRLQGTIAKLLPKQDPERKAEDSAK